MAGIKMIPTASAAPANPGMDMAAALMQPQSAEPAYGTDGNWPGSGSM